MEDSLQTLCSPVQSRSSFGRFSGKLPTGVALVPRPILLELPVDVTSISSTSASEPFVFLRSSASYVPEEHSNQEINCSSILLNSTHLFP